MRQPQGFDDGTEHVARLIQSLYGLRQAARVWNKHLHRELTTVAYHQTYSDTAVYVRRSNVGHVVILAIHVDNILSFRDNLDGLKVARAELHKIFKMMEEDPNWVMGFQLIENRHERTIAIDHSQYIEALLRRFNMEQCNPSDIPLNPGKVLSNVDSPTSDKEKAEMNGVPYRELVGGLIWLAVVSKVQLAFAATHLAHFNANPGVTHWRAAKHVL